MHQKTPDELLVFQGDILVFASFVILCGESDMSFPHGEDTGVGDSNAVSIASQVFDGISETVKGLLDVGAPILPVKAVAEFIPGIEAAQSLAGRGKGKFL